MECIQSFIDEIQESPEKIEIKIKKIKSGSV